MTSSRIRLHTDRDGPSSMNDGGVFDAIATQQSDALDAKHACLASLAPSPVRIYAVDLPFALGAWRETTCPGKRPTSDLPGDVTHIVFGIADYETLLDKMVADRQPSSIVHTHIEQTAGRLLRRARNARVRIACVLLPPDDASRRGEMHRYNVLQCVMWPIASCVVLYNPTCECAFAWAMRNPVTLGHAR